MSDLAGIYSNPAYKITLKTPYVDPSSNDFLNIEGFMPESLAINVTSTWDSLLKSFLSGDISFSGSNRVTSALGTLASGAQSIMRILGMRTAYSQISTFPSWTGTEPLEFSIPFVFHAINNTRENVTKPWINLMKVVCPTKEGLIMKAPGPQFVWDPNQHKPIFKKDRILSLSIGQFIYIRGVIVTAVNNTLYSKFDKDGLPIQAQADVTLRTTFSPTTQDIQEWFSFNQSYDQVSNAIKELQGIVDNPKAYVKGLIADTKEAASYVSSEAKIVGADTIEKFT